jgi:hypothetical protein
VDQATLASISSIVGAFGAGMLFFRIGRELQMQSKNEPIWIPRADLLILGATLLSLFQLLLLIAVDEFSQIRLLARAMTGSSIVLLIAYLPALLSHYRIWFGRGRTGPREIGEPWEILFVYGGGLIAVTIMIIAIVMVFVIR